MYVVTNRIRVYSARAREFEERFERRKRGVDSARGFSRMEILRPISRKRNEHSGKWETVEPAPEILEYEVRSYWDTLEDYEAWKDSDAFRTTHQEVLDQRRRPDASRLPEGLVAGRPSISFFQVVPDGEQLDEPDLKHSVG